MKREQITDSYKLKNMKAMLKTIGRCVLALAITACSKEKGATPQGTDECWYRVTIGGETITSNTFGQDRISFSTSADREDPNDRAVVFGIYQGKENNPLPLIVGANALLNSELPTGTYRTGAFGTPDFNTPGSSRWPYYTFTDEDDMAAAMTFALLENSDQRIRVSVTGMVPKYINEEMGLGGVVPVEVELTIGRQHYAEFLIDGILVGGAKCDCQR